MSSPVKAAQSVADVLLRVHRSYLAILRPHLSRVHALAHITGGGIPGNLNRALPPSLDAVVHTASWRVPNVFEQLGAAGGVPRDELFRAFNMGVGMMALVAPEDAEAVIAVRDAVGVKAWRRRRGRAGSGAVRLDGRRHAGRTVVGAPIPAGESRRAFAKDDGWMARALELARAWLGTGVAESTRWRRAGEGRCDRGRGRPSAVRRSARRGRGDRRRR